MTIIVAVSTKNNNLFGCIFLDLTVFVYTKLVLINRKMNYPHIDKSPIPRKEIGPRMSSRADFLGLQKKKLQLQNNENKETYYDPFKRVKKSF